MKPTNRTTRIILPRPGCYATPPDPEPTGNPADDKNKQEFIPKAQFDELVAQRDALKADITGLKRQIAGFQGSETKLKEMETQLAGMTELQNKLKELQAQEEARKQKDMSEVERLQAQLQKALGEVDTLKAGADQRVQALQDEFNAKLAEATGRVTALQSYKLKADVQAAATDAANPEHIFAMVQNAFKLNESGEWVAEKQTRNGVKELPVREYVAEFLADKTNAYLLKTPAQPRTTPDNTSDKSKEITLTPEQKRDALINGYTEEQYGAYLLTLQKAQDKLAERLKAGVPAETVLLPGQIRLSGR